MAYRMLAVGSDSDLLATRNVALREAGFSIHSRKPTQAMTLFREEDFDVVLLCHTIPVKRVEQLIQLLKEEKPHTPVVVLSKNSHRAAGADAAIHSLDSPEELLRQIVEVVAASSAPRRNKGRTT